MSFEPQGNQVLRFGIFEADLGARELRRNGANVRLQEQPFQVLAQLLAKPGTVVTREELQAKLWSSDTFVDFDHGLNAAVKRLRDALGDTAENPRFVETVARRGYRFIAPVGMPVERPAAREGKSESKTESAGIPELRKGWRVAIPLLAFPLVLVGIGVGWHAGRRSAAAVLPMERRLTGSPRNDPIWSAAVSPDGKYLAFADRTGAYLRVLVSGETHSVSTGDDLRTGSLAWFPDGSHLLATRRRWPQGKPGLWILSVLGGEPRQLIEDGSQGVVSPNGTQVAFVRGDYTQQEIWTARANGEHPTKIFRLTGGGFGSVTWSPDGQRIAFLRYEYMPGNDRADVSIGVTDPATGATEYVLRDPNLWDGIAWSPDGRLIYSRSESAPNRGDSNLWAQKIDAHSYKPWGPPVRLTRGPDAKAGINVSADGKRLMYMRWFESPDIYIAEVRDHGGKLTSLQRLRLGEGKNRPYAWTTDNRSIIFTSDRDGVSHLYKQGADQAAPDMLVGGETTVSLARLDPEGAGILYLLTPGSSSQPTEIMRIPVAGGPARVVVSENGINNFQCARAPSRACVFSRMTDNKALFYTFNPETGEHHQFRTIEAPEWYLQNWSLSPDGQTLAMSGAKQHRVASKAIVRLAPVAGGEERRLELQNWFAIACLDWAADGTSIWVNASNAAGTQTLLNVDLHGHVKPALAETEMELGWAIPSPDGKRVALWKAETSSNAWLLENF